MSLRGTVAIALGLVAWVMMAWVPEAPVAETGKPGAGPVWDAVAWRVVAVPEESRVRFTLGATLHRVEGTAELSRGELQLDGATGRVEGELEIDARSLATGNAMRDRDMHRKVLDSDAHPLIVLLPRGFEGELPRGGGPLELHFEGELEIHGGTHPLAFSVEGTLDEQGRAVVHTTFTVPYVEWGMADPSKWLLRVEKSVEVDVELVARVEAVA